MLKRIFSHRVILVKEWGYYWSGRGDLTIDILTGSDERFIIVGGWLPLPQVEGGQLLTIAKRITGGWRIVRW